MGRPNRYSNMTAEQFEEDVKKKSLSGAVVIGFERSIRRREADLIIEEKLRHDKDETPEAGEPPEDN